MIEELYMTDDEIAEKSKNMSDEEILMRDIKIAKEAREMWDTTMRKIRKNDAYVDQHIRGFDVRINAYEKQIPKKPVAKLYSEGWHMCECPICGKHFGYLETSFAKRNTHCIDCGQAIDWSESDDK